MPGILLCCLACWAHRGAPLAGVLLCSLAYQSLKGAPWVGSYPVVQCVRRLMGQPLYCSPSDAGVWGMRETMVMAPPPIHDSAVSPCFHGAWFSSTGICHHNLLPHIPSIRLSAVNSSPHLGIAPQSLNSSSQLLPLPGDPCSCLAYVWVLQGLSDSHSIQTATDQLFHSQP